MTPISPVIVLSVLALQDLLVEAARAAIELERSWNGIDELTVEGIAFNIVQRTISD